MIFVAAAFFLAMGIMALISPSMVARQFQVMNLTSVGRNEVRAVYGGFGVAVGFALIYAADDHRVGPGITLAVAIALVGMAAGRVVSALIDRTLGWFSMLFLAVECLLAALLFAAW